MRYCIREEASGCGKAFRPLVVTSAKPFQGMEEMRGIHLLSFPFEFSPNFFDSLENLIVPACVQRLTSG